MSDASARLELSLEAQSLEPGQTISLQCPFCHDTRRKTMYITLREDGALLFNCFRASCGAKGRIGGNAALVRTRQPPRASKVKPEIVDRLRFLNRDDLPGGKLWELEYTDLTIAGCRWDPETNRLALPVGDVYGVRRGWVLRSLNPDVQPKALAWPTVPGPSLGWNLCTPTGQVVVVEDIPSSIQLGSVGCPAVALQGVHFSDEAVEELASEVDDLVIALDKDALQKSLAWAKKLRMMFRRVAVLSIEKDFKNMTKGEVVRCLSEISWLRLSNHERATTESPPS